MRSLRDLIPRLKNDRKKCLTDHVRRAYREIGRTTPISADCGELCGAACCKEPEDADTEYGMLLFPGEEKLLRDDPHFKLTQLPPPEHFRHKVWFATCDGHCDRRKRPLSCRIFPCVTYLAENAKRVAVIPDPRANAVCPLVARGADYTEEAFKEAVSRAGNALLGCKRQRAFLEDLSRLIEEYRRYVL